MTREREELPPMRLLEAPPFLRPPQRGQGETKLFDLEQPMRMLQSQRAQEMGRARDAVMQAQQQGYLRRLAEVEAQGGDAGPAPGPSGGVFDVPANFGPQVKTAAAKHGVPVELLASTFWNESRWNPNAVNPNDQGPGVNSVGLGQWGEQWAKARGFDPRDPNASIDHTAAAMKEYATKYGGNWLLARLAYGWGPGNVDKWLQAGGDPQKIPDGARVWLPRTAFGIADDQQARASFPRVAPMLRPGPVRSPWGESKGYAEGGPVQANPQDRIRALVAQGHTLGQALLIVQREIDTRAYSDSIADSTKQKDKLPDMGGAIAKFEEGGQVRRRKRTSVDDMTAGDPDAYADEGYLNRSQPPDVDPAYTTLRRAFMQPHTAQGAAVRAVFARAGMNADDPKLWDAIVSNPRALQRVAGEVEKVAPQFDPNFAQRMANPIAKGITNITGLPGTVLELADMAQGAFSGKPSGLGEISQRWLGPEAQRGALRSLGVMPANPAYQHPTGTGRGLDAATELLASGLMPFGYLSTPAKAVAPATSTFGRARQGTGDALRALSGTQRVPRDYADAVGLWQPGNAAIGAPLSTLGAFSDER